MVRRRGIYEIKIRDKQLVCSFCQNSHFRHREIYLDLMPGPKEVKDQLTLQSFSCTSCSNIQMFQEKNRFDHSLKKHVSTTEYSEVSKE